MRDVLLFFAAALMSASAADRSAAQGLGGFSAWQGAPSAQDVQRAYPPAARKAHIGGTVTLACAVGVDGYLKSCSVVAETPRGYGFGAAALSLAGKLRMEPKMARGQPVEGGTARIPIVFSLPDQATSV